MTNEERFIEYRAQLDEKYRKDVVQLWRGFELATQALLDHGEDSDEYIDRLSDAFNDAWGITGWNWTEDVGWFDWQLKATAREIVAEGFSRSLARLAQNYYDDLRNQKTALAV